MLNQINTQKSISQLCQTYLRTLCVDIPERCVGSDGNRQAARFFRDEISSFGWQVEAQTFEAVDWENGGASPQEGFDKMTNSDFRGGVVGMFERIIEAK